MAFVGKVYVFNLSKDKITSLKINGNRVARINGWFTKDEGFPDARLYVPFGLTLPLVDTSKGGSQKGGVLLNKANKLEVNWESGPFNVTVIPIAHAETPIDSLEFVIYLNFNDTLLLDNRGHILGEYQTDQNSKI